MSKSKFEDAACKALLTHIINEFHSYIEYGSFEVKYEREKTVITKIGTHGRLDLYIKVSCPKGGYCCQFNVEAKSSTADLESPYGKNLFNEGGNFIIYPRNAFDWVLYGAQMDKEFLSEWLDKNGYKHVGIFCLEPDGSVTCERMAKLYMANSNIA